MNKQEFLEELGKLKHLGWDNEDSYIRCSKDCPITAVFKSVHDEHSDDLGSEDWRACTDDLGLSLFLANLLVDAGRLQMVG